jgi:hypothetical protein
MMRYHSQRAFRIAKGDTTGQKFNGNASFNPPMTWVSCCAAIPITVCIAVILQISEDL